MIEAGFYNMDCMVAMKEFPDGFFDLAVVDPPYGIGIFSMNYVKSGNVRIGRQKVAKRRDYRKKAEWDYLPNEDYFKELQRISKRQIIWGGGTILQIFCTLQSHG